MNKFLPALFALLIVTSAFADGSRSRWLAGGEIDFSVVEVNPNCTGNDVHFYGNGDVLIRGGYEFRLLDWFSFAPALGVERNGWSWDHSDSEGSISYLYLFAEVRMNFHVMEAHLSLGGSFGMPFFFWGELDGKKTTEGLEGMEYGMSFFYDVGYTIKDRHRVGFGQKVFYTEQNVAQTNQFFVFTMGLSYTHLF